MDLVDEGVSKFKSPVVNARVMTHGRLWPTYDQLETNAVVNVNKVNDSIHLIDA